MRVWRPHSASSPTRASRSTRERVKVLVREKIGDSGVQLLRDAGLDVEIGTDWDQDELERRIGEFDGILIRSATQLDADLLERAERLKAVGRAGVGVDNVDVDAATTCSAAWYPARSVASVVEAPRCGVTTTFG